MRFTAAVAMLVLCVDPHSGFQLTGNFSPFGKKMADGKGSSPYLENMRASSSSYAASPATPANTFLASGATNNSPPPSNYSPFGKKMADGKSGSAYLNAMTGASTSTPSYEAPVTSSYQPAPSNAAMPSTATYVKPSSYSPFGKKMADGKGSSAYLNAVAGNSAPSDEAAVTSNYQPVPSNAAMPSTASYVKPSSYSPFGKKMADGKGSSAYLNAVAGNSAPSYEVPVTSNYQPVPSNAAMPSTASYVKPSSYSPFGKKMADGKGSSAYLNAVAGNSPPSYEAPVTSSYQPAPSNAAMPSTASYVKPSSYSPFGKKMADGKGSSAYLNAVAAVAGNSAPSDEAPVTYSYQPAPVAPTSSSNIGMSSSVSSVKPSSYSPFGKKMADGQGSSAYLNAMTGASAPSYEAPAASVTPSYEPSPSAPAASTSSYLNMGSTSAAPKPGSYSPFGKKMADGKGSSSYLNNVSGSSKASGSYSPFGKKMADGKGSSAYLNAMTGASAPSFESFTAPVTSAPASQSFEPTPAAPAASTSSYLNMGSTSSAPKPGSYSPFGKKMADGKGSSSYLNNVSGSSKASGSYSPFGKKMADGKGSSAYLNAMTGASAPSFDSFTAPVTSAPASQSYEPTPAAPAASTSSYLNMGSTSAAPKTGSYSPFGKKMADGKGSSSYLNNVSGSSKASGSYSPFGKKMADGKGSSAYLNAMTGASAPSFESFTAPVTPESVASSYAPAPVTPAASTSSYLDMGSASAAPKPGSYSPFGKKMADGKGSSSYLNNVSGSSKASGSYSPFGKKMADSKSSSAYLNTMTGASAPSYAPSAPSSAPEPVTTSYAPSAPAAPASSASSYLNMGSTSATPKPGSYSPFGKKMSDGKSSSSYLNTVSGPSSSGGYSPFGKKMADGKGSSSYLNSVAGATAPSFDSFKAPSAPATSEPVTASYAPAPVATPASYGSAPAAEPPAAPATAGSTGFSYLNTLAPVNPAPFKYAPVDGKMSDARSGNSYLDGLRNYEPVSTSYGSLQDSFSSASGVNEMSGRQ